MWSLAVHTLLCCLNEIVTPSPQLKQSTGVLGFGKFVLIFLCEYFPNRFRGSPDIAAPPLAALSILVPSRLSVGKSQDFISASSRIFSSEVPIMIWSLIAVFCAVQSAFSHLKPQCLDSFSTLLQKVANDSFVSWSNDRN